MHNPHLERIGITRFRESHTSCKQAPTCYTFTDQCALQLIVSESLYQAYSELLTKLLKAGRLNFLTGPSSQPAVVPCAHNIKVRLFLGVDEAKKWCNIPVAAPGWLSEIYHELRLLVLDAPADLVSSVACKKRTWRWLQEAMVLSDNSVLQ